MSKLCQGPSCHMYDTTDRKRGPKGNKKNYTRTVGQYGYGDRNFCTLSCQNDWWAEHGTRAVEYIGILENVKLCYQKTLVSNVNDIVGNEIMEKQNTTTIICVQVNKDH